MKRSPPEDDFVRHVVDSLCELGSVDVRRMFGGWGLYHQGAFFALIMRGTLYLKTDARNRAQFDAMGLEPFTFEKGGETIVTAYRAAPEEAFEDRTVMARWARGAYEAALRKSAKRPARHS